MNILFMQTHEKDFFLWQTLNELWFMSNTYTLHFSGGNILYHVIRYLHIFSSLILFLILQKRHCRIPPRPPNKMSIIPAKTTLLFARLEQFHFFLVLISWSFSGLFCFNVLQLTLPQGISFYFYFFYEVHNFHWSPFFPSCN